MTASVAASPSPSSIIRPYWKPEQPPPCTKTRRPACVLFSSDSNSLIFEAAVGVTLIMWTVLLLSIIHWRRGLPSYWTHLAPGRLRLDRRPDRRRRPGNRQPPWLAGHTDGHAARAGPGRGTRRRGPPRRHLDRLPARHGRQQPLRRSDAQRLRDPRRLPAAGGDGHHRRSRDPRRHRAPRAGAHAVP